MDKSDECPHDPMHWDAYYIVDAPPDVYCGDCGALLGMREMLLCISDGMRELAQRKTMTEKTDDELLIEAALYSKLIKDHVVWADLIDVRCKCGYQRLISEEDIDEGTAEVADHLRALHTNAGGDPK